MRTSIVCTLLLFFSFQTIVNIVVMTVTMMMVKQVMMMGMNAQHKIYVDVVVDPVKMVVLIVKSHAFQLVFQFTRRAKAKVLSRRLIATVEPLLLAQKFF